MIKLKWHSLQLEKHAWFECKQRRDVYQYSWAGKKVTEGQTVPKKCIDALSKGEKKASEEFEPFLHRKFPNQML